MSVARYFSVEIGITFSSIAIEKLLSRMDRIGILSRTAVSKSMPVKPIAASPHTLMHSLSGLAVLRAFAVELLHLCDQALQHELGVARDSQRHGDVLVDVGGIERRLDDLDAGRHLDAEVGLRERAADPEDQVRLVEEGAHRL